MVMEWMGDAQEGMRNRTYSRQMASAPMLVIWTLSALPLVGEKLEVVLWSWFFGKVVLLGRGNMGVQRCRSSNSE